MVQSINTKVDLTIDATSYLGVADYGKIMIGDKGLNFSIIEMQESLFKFLGKK